MALNPVLLKAVRKLLHHGSTDRATRITLKLTLTEITELSAALNRVELGQFTSLLLSTERAGDLTRTLPAEALDRMLAAMTDDRLASHLDRLPGDVAVRLMSHLPELRRDDLLSRLNPSVREELRGLAAAELAASAPAPEGRSSSLRELTALAYASLLARALRGRKRSVSS